MNKTKYGPFLATFTASWPNLISIKILLLKLNKTILPGVKKDVRISNLLSELKKKLFRIRYLRSIDNFKALNLNFNAILK